MASTNSAAYPQSRWASIFPSTSSFCRPSLILAAARDIFRVTKFSARRGLSWLKHIALQKNRPCESR